MDFLGAVHGDRHHLDVLGHHAVGHPVQQGTVGLQVDHEAPALGFAQQGGEMGVQGGFPAGKVEPGPEGGYLIQEADPGGQGELPARVVPGEPGGAGVMAVLLTHDAFQVAAPGEVEVEVGRRAAPAVPEAAVQLDAEFLAVLLPQQGVGHAGVAPHELQAPGGQGGFGPGRGGLSFRLGRWVRHRFILKNSGQRSAISFQPRSASSVRCLNRGWPRLPCPRRHKNNYGVCQKFLSDCRF
jgi:hypothetical protein